MGAIFGSFFWQQDVPKSPSGLWVKTHSEVKLSLTSQEENRVFKQLFTSEELQMSNIVKNQTVLLIILSLNILYKIKWGLF